MIFLKKFQGRGPLHQPLVHAERPACVGLLGRLRRPLRAQLLLRHSGYSTWYFLFIYFLNESIFLNFRRGNYIQLLSRRGPEEGQKRRKVPVSFLFIK